MRGVPRVRAARDAVGVHRGGRAADRRRSGGGHRVAPGTRGDRGAPCCRSQFAPGTSGTGDAACARAGSAGIVRARARARAWECFNDRRFGTNADALSNGHPSPRTSRSHGRSACTRAIDPASPVGADEPRSSYDRYAIAVRTWSKGDVVWSRSDLRSSLIDGKTAVIARLTGDVFSPGAYEIRLTNSPDDSPPSDVAFYEIAVGQPGS